MLKQPQEKCFMINYGLFWNKCQNRKPHQRKSQQRNTDIKKLKGHFRTDKCNNYNKMLSGWTPKQNEEWNGKSLQTTQTATGK